MADIPLVLAADEIVVIAIVGGLAIAIISIVFSYVHKMVRESSRSKVQREIAAYVAEGTMRPEDGERLMRAASEPLKEEA